MTKSPKVRAPVEQVVDEMDAYFQIPLSRPRRFWIALGALAILSALGGAVAGVRSQDDGPRGQMVPVLGR
jgi:hypothetical protein